MKQADNGGMEEHEVCPRCGARARSTPNPYYGSGLAVHRAVLTCAACGYTALQENEAVEVEAEPPARRAGPLRRVLAFILHD